MMKWFFSGLIVLSIIFAALSGKMDSLSETAVSEGGNAITLCLTLAGIVCLWSAIMRIARKAGLIEALARAFTPLLSKLFKGLNSKGTAMGYIVLNITANLLGLGNASTPFGIAAMQELEKEERSGETATDNMILFVILNTASLQIIPATVAALRLKNGSTDPMEILMPVWLASAATATVAIVLAKILQKCTRRRI
ncbi:MAG: spore maturation protein A [Eubacterium sp.]|jgi:spore maturation protein A|nr:spore maturation protein A [Eubacterium sp.]